jgi:hypothetical protein
MALLKSAPGLSTQKALPVRQFERWHCDDGSMCLAGSVACAWLALWHVPGWQCGGGSMCLEDAWCTYERTCEHMSVKQGTSSLVLKDFTVEAVIQCST